MSNVAVNIGRLTYQRDAVGKGHYGKVYSGRFENALDVTIVRVDKSDIIADTTLLRQTDMHPNIVRFYGAEEDDEFQYIATEMCTGNLKQLVRGEYNSLAPHPPIADKEMLRQITCGLQYLHKKNICHRDIKPSNIFISRSDATLRPQLKLGNSFGFNCTAAAIKLPLWKLVGMSKAWVAPDIYDVANTIFTKDMDIFCLGLVFVFVLTGGNHAFGTEKEEIILNIKKKKPMSFTIQQLKDTVDGTAGVKELIQSMLSFRPEERPSATGVFSYTYFTQPMFLPRRDVSPPTVSSRHRRRSSIQTHSPTNVFKRESMEVNENVSPPPPLQTASETVNSLPSLSPIRLPSGEFLLRREEAESISQQQLPITPISATPPSPFRDSVSSSVACASTSYYQLSGEQSTHQAQDTQIPIPVSPTTTTGPSLFQADFVISETAIKTELIMERDQEDIAHPQNNPRILFTSPLPNGNSNPPPLVPIRLSNGESLPKRMRQEEINQRLTVCDNPNTSSSSTSSSTTWPLGSPQSHSPFLNLTVDVTSPGDEQTSSPSNHVPCSLSPQPSTSPRGLANLSDPASCNLVVPLSTSLRRTLLPNPVSRVIASVPSSGFSLPPPAVFDSQPSTSSSERSSEHSTSEPTSDSDRDATAPKNTQNRRQPITAPTPSPDTSLDNAPVHELFQKEKELMDLCSQKKLNRRQFDRLIELIQDRDVDITYTIKYKTPLLLLCQWNRSEHLYSILQILLKRDDLDINATSLGGFNALMFLSRFYPGADLLDCAQLLIDRGINAELKDRRTEQRAINILWDRKLYSESKHLAQMIRSRR